MVLLFLSPNAFFIVPPRYGLTIKMEADLNSSNGAIMVQQKECLTQRLGSNPGSPVYSVCVVISLNLLLLPSKMQRMPIITFSRIVVFNEMPNVSVFYL